MGGMLDEQGQLGAVRDLLPGEGGAITLAEAGLGEREHPAVGARPPTDTPARSAER
jgi:hypothetical protein